MNRTKIALAVALAVTGISVTLLWPKLDKPSSATGSQPTQTAAAKTKPICATPTNSSTAPPIDCVPANLPPDPGSAGKATLDGLCATETGALEPCDPENHPERLRADVQRWIITEWGHSPIAMKGLELSALQQLRAIHYNDSLGKKDTYERFATQSMRESACVSRLETLEMQAAGAHSRLTEQVDNTDARKLQSHKFDLMFATTFTPGFSGTASEACGFDVNKMARAEGKQTVAQMLADEVDARAKAEEEKK